MKVLVIGLLPRQERLIEEACAKLRGLELQFIDYAPMQTFPRVDLCIETRFMSHTTHRQAIKKIKKYGTKKIVYVHGGLGSIKRAIESAYARASSGGRFKATRSQG